ncbi:competence protein CoiA family protein [Clostridioides difficile]
MEKKILIPFALVGTKVKHIKDITKADECRCLECGGNLITREGEKNIKHLAHKNETNCFYKNEFEYKNSGVESYEHKFFKAYLKDNLKYFREFYTEILIKNNEFKLGGEKYSEVKNIYVEYRNLKKHLKLEKEYFPDILLETDEKYIAIEIYNTNKKDTDSLERNLIGKNIDVYEIDINKITDLEVNKLIKDKEIKLVFSNLKIEYEKSINIIQNELLEYRQKYNETETLYNQIRLENEKLNKENLILKQKLSDEIEENTNQIKNLKKKIKDMDMKNFEYREKYISDIRNNMNDNIRRKMEGTGDGIFVEISKKFNKLIKKFILNGNIQDLEKIKKFYNDYIENIELLENNQKKLAEILEIKMN